jgi:hypothetical protein
MSEAGAEPVKWSASDRCISRLEVTRKRLTNPRLERPPDGEDKKSLKKPIIERGRGKKEKGK